jgi:uncharacterized protein YndB with AHSA1/START domain
VRPISAEISIDVPRERVFDLLIDLSIRPQFTDHFLCEYRLARLEPVGVGASARYRIGESGPWMDSAIEVAERPHVIRERGESGRLNRVPTFTVWELAEGASPTSTELTVTFWTEPQNRFDRLREHRRLVRHLRRGFKRALVRLRDMAEVGASLEHVGVAGGDRLPAFNL